MNSVINVIVWWTGAVAILAALTCCTAILAWVFHQCASEIGKWCLHVVRLSTVRYWVQRMEDEGLTVCRKEYRRIVAERKPRTPAEFAKIEREDDARGRSNQEGGAA